MFEKPAELIEVRWRPIGLTEFFIRASFELIKRFLLPPAEPQAIKTPFVNARTSYCSSSPSATFNPSLVAL